MKISKEKLKELIAEEMSIGFASAEEVGGSEPHDPDGSMAKQNLWKLAEYAKELYQLIDENEDLEPWVEEKIAIASFMMDSVGHYMQYKKHQSGETESEDEESYELDLDDSEQSEDYEDEEEI